MADMERSRAVCENLYTALNQLRAIGEANGDGPCEKETNKRLLAEKISRSIHHTDGELHKVREDIEMLARFCDGGKVSAIYDSYNVTDGDVQKIVEHAAQKAAHHSAGAVFNGGLAHAPDARPFDNNVVIIPP